MNGAKPRRRGREEVGSDGSCTSSIYISLSSTLPLADQIAEVNRLLSGWLSQLEEPFDDDLDGVFLTECRLRGNQRIYCYEILEKYPS